MNLYRECRDIFSEICDLPGSIRYIICKLTRNRKCFVLILYVKTGPRVNESKVLCQEPAKMVFYIIHLSNVITLGNAAKLNLMKSFIENVM